MRGRILRRAGGSRWWSRIAPLLAVSLLLSGCGAASALNPFASAGIVALSKVDGWRDGLFESFPDPPFALLEVAPDRETAERAWRENVPEDLPERSGRPDREGQYGDLAGVDFDSEVVVVWSSGQSGTCPGWLAGVETRDDGTVEVTRGVRGRQCTDDYLNYRMVVAVDRDQLPDLSQLPTREVEVDGRQLAADSLVRAYPAA